MAKDIADSIQEEYTEGVVAVIPLKSCLRNFKIINQAIFRRNSKKSFLEISPQITFFFRLFHSDFIWQIYSRLSRFCFWKISKAIPLKMLCTIFLFWKTASPILSIHVLKNRFHFHCEFLRNFFLIILSAAPMETLPRIPSEIVSVVLFEIAWKLRHFIGNLGGNFFGIYLKDSFNNFLGIDKMIWLFV